MSFVVSEVLKKYIKLIITSQNLQFIYLSFLKFIISAQWATLIKAQRVVLTD